MRRSQTRPEPYEVRDPTPPPVPPEDKHRSTEADLLRQLVTEVVQLRTDLNVGVAAIVNGLIDVKDAIADLKSDIVTKAASPYEP